MSYIYTVGAQTLASGLDWTTHADGFRAYAFAGDFDDVLHQILSDVEASDLLGFASLSARSLVAVTGGRGFDCADFSIPNVTGTVKGVLIVRWDSASSGENSPLIAYIDDGLPLVLSNQALNVTVSAGGLFSVTADNA